MINYNSKNVKGNAWEAAALPAEEDSSGYVTRGGALSLSNPGQLELLNSVTGRGAALRTPVRGFSMHPFIRDQDVLTVSPLPKRRFRPGDVVAFTSPDTGRLAIHRVISASATGWLVRGDNCPEADGVIDSKQIIGQVTGIERRGRQVRLGLGCAGRVIAFLNRGRGLCLLKQAVLFPRRTASYGLRRVQGLALYRRLGRRLSTPIRVETATESDLDTVFKMLNPQSLPAKRETNPRVTNFVARRGAGTVGFVQLVNHPPEHQPWVGYWLFSLHVQTPYRGLGIGEELVRAVVDRAVDQEAGELLLVVNEDNFAAVKLYEKTGFHQVALPALEPLLSAERVKTGRRRIVMRRELN